MASLTVFSILVFVGPSLAEIYQLSLAEKQEIMNEVDRLKGLIVNLRNKMQGERNPVAYESVTWSDDLARSAEAVAHRCVYGCQSLPHGDLSNIREHYGYVLSIPQRTIHNLKGFIKRSYDSELAQVKSDLNLQSLREAVQHYKFSFEGKYIGCGAVTHSHGGRPFVHIVCHFSREP